jgi:hypothetical protein
MFQICQRLPALIQWLSSNAGSSHGAAALPCDRPYLAAGAGRPVHRRGPAPGTQGGQASPLRQRGDGPGNRQGNQPVRQTDEKVQSVLGDHQDAVIARQAERKLGVSAQPGRRERSATACCTGAAPATRHAFRRRDGKRDSARPAPAAGAGCTRPPPPYGQPTSSAMMRAVTGTPRCSGVLPGPGVPPLPPGVSTGLPAARQHGCPGASRRATAPGRLAPDPLHTDCRSRVPCSSSMPIPARNCSRPNGETSQSTPVRSPAARASSRVKRE